MNLKRGDRIRLIAREHLAGLPKGSVGTVLRDHDAGGDSIAVSFDGFKGGHWADGVIPSTEPASGWYVLSRDIEVVEDPTNCGVCGEYLQFCEHNGTEELNASNANCETSSHETANLELQKDVDRSGSVDASASDAERYVRQGLERRGNDGKKRDR